ncbi:MAG TPA: nuclear transport factor 2 family protein [Candidatus Angelobacter sp.]|nr:nuclear transport factor 2 family protein [Candidatus Angelobacter sp.]
MKNDLVIRSLRSGIRKMGLVLLAAVFVLTSVSSAVAQQNDKKKKKQPPPDNSKTVLPMADESQIDYMLSEMLGAWQIGDVEKLHSKYADDVSLVNGSWAPPILGWTNYLAIYQEQRTHMQRVSLERSNTYIKVNGNFGWACYQWDFSAVVDGKQMQSQGHTTVVVEKRNDHWIIVHNHTSLAPAPQPAAPAKTPPAAQPDKPNGD